MSDVRTVRVNMIASNQLYDQSMKRSAAATAATQAQIRGVNTTGGGMVRMLGRLTPLLIGGAGLVAGMKVTAGAAINFETSAVRLRTQIGLTAGQMHEMAEASREVGRATGQGAQAAINASFFIASAGLRGQTALDALEASAQAARLGLGDMNTVADLVTSAINAYGSDVLDAAQATDILIGSVREGKAEAPELAAALGMVLPIASEMGVTFDQVGAAVAAMTRTGTNAGTASMQLRQILASLLNPTSQVREAMEEFGLSADEVRATIRDDGLWQALVDLREATGGSEEALGRLFPNVRALAGFLDLTGANAAENAKIFAALTDTYGLLEQGIESLERTTGDRIARVGAHFKDAGLAIGRFFQPALDDVLDGILQIASTPGVSTSSPTAGLSEADFRHRESLMRQLLFMNFDQGLDNLLVRLGAIDELETAAGQRLIGELGSRAAGGDAEAINMLREFAAMDIGQTTAGFIADALSRTAELPWDDMRRLEAWFPHLAEGAEEFATSTDRARASMARLTSAFTEQADPFVRLEAARDRLNQMQEDGTASNLELALAIAEVGAAEAEVAGGTSRVSEEFKNLLRQAGQTEDEIRELELSLLETRLEARDNVEAVEDLGESLGELTGQDWKFVLEADVDQAEQDANDFIVLLNTIDGRTVRTVVGVDTSEAERSIRRINNMLSAANISAQERDALFPGVPVRHGGGMAGAGGWRRMHTGGLAGDEIPTILQRGELVINRNNVRDAGGAVAIERALAGIANGAASPLAGATFTTIAPSTDAREIVAEQQRALNRTLILAGVG